MSSLPAEPDATLIELGQRIRTFRRRRGLRLEDVALRAGLSKSLLSMVERGRVNSTVATLVGIAHALRVPIADLFDGQDGGPEPVLARDRQRVLVGPEGERRVFALNRSRRIEFSENVYRPGAESAPEPIRHAGWECGVLAEGALEAVIGGRSYTLAAGDAFAFASTQPHRLRNPGPGAARLFWVNAYDDPAERERPPAEGE